MIHLIIPVHNRIEYLKRCLQSVYTANLSEVSTITLVDDGSVEEVQEYIQKIGSPEDTLLVKRRNDISIGIKRTLIKLLDESNENYKTTVILDSDAIISPDAFTRLLELKRQYKEHIVSGFISGTNEEANPDLWVKDTHIARKLCMGINVVFDKDQYEPIIKQALMTDGDWDMNIAKFTDKETIITKPSVVQHIGFSSTFNRGDAVHLAKDFSHTPYDITLIHPSRSRPVHAYQTIDKWMSNAKNANKIEYILVLDDDDPLLHLYSQVLVGKYENRIKIIVQPKKRKWYQKKSNLNAITGINIGGYMALGNLMIAISDDFSCPQYWDKQLLFYTDGLKDIVVKTEDGSGNDWLCTLPIVDKAWFNRFGYIYNPMYKHMFADTELSSVAEMTGRLIKLPIYFEHQHYMHGKGTMDKVNEKNNSTWAQGEAVYLKRIFQNFGLTKAQIVQPMIANKGHRDWLETKNIIMRHGKFYDSDGIQYASNVKTN